MDQQFPLIVLAPIILAVFYKHMIIHARISILLTHVAKDYSQSRTQSLQLSFAQEGEPEGRESLEPISATSDDCV